MIPAGLALAGLLAADGYPAFASRMKAYRERAANHAGQK